MSAQPIGVISHYYDKIGVAAVKLSAALSVGESIRVHGKKSDFSQTVQSLQLDHEGVERAEAGSEVGIKLDQQAEKGDSVEKMTADFS